MPISHYVAWAEAYLHTKWHLDPSTVWLYAADMDQQWGAVSLLDERSWVPI